MAENPSSAANATIRRATFGAHKSVESLDAVALADLERIYKVAAADLADRIQAHAGPGGSVALQELRSVLAQVEARLRELGQARDALLGRNLIAAADLGVQPFTATAVMDIGAGMRVSNEAVEFVRNFIAEDGLQLSDRLWRMDRGTRDAIVNTIEQAVIQGHSADQAARDLLMRGVGVPADVQAKLQAARAAGISEAVQRRMVAEESGGALYNAKRVMRTEINRAHGEAYMASAEAAPDFGGHQYLLSPAHPRPDICDLLSTQNLYGLGPGVYPDRARTPWPAHPNTISFTLRVAKSAITDEDRAGKETTMEALARLTEKQQEGVLGQGKAALYDAGRLTKGMIRAPLRAVQVRLKRQGRG